MQVFILVPPKVPQEGTLNIPWIYICSFYQIPWLYAQTEHQLACCYHFKYFNWKSGKKINFWL